MTIPLDLPTGKPGAVLILCVFGAMITVLSWRHYSDSRAAESLYEFSTRHPGILVPVLCGGAPGKAGIDFVQAPGRTIFKPSRNRDRPSHVDACWYPMDRYANFFVGGGSAMDAANKQYESLSLERLDLKPAKAQTWSLLSIPVGVFIFMIGASVPFIRPVPRASSGRSGDQRPSVDPAVLQAELSRLRQKLKA